jgi:acetate kinase
MNILTINSGSTSIKFKLYRMPQEEVLASGKIENIGLSNSFFSLTTKQIDQKNQKIEIKDHKQGLTFIIDTLTDRDLNLIKDKKEIHAIGHRVVNVGDRIDTHQIINDQLLETLRECIDLAPLHNPPNLVGIEVSLDVFGKDIKNAAIFDNIFHKDMPKKAFLYGIPYDYYEKYRIRKYGFHGIAYTYMASCAARIAGKDLKKSKLILMMLGGGSSITAVDKGISVDTSMGFTPTEGLIMSTRCGDIDPAIIPFIMNRENLSCKDADDLINKKSGLLGLSKKHSNFIDIYNGVLNNDESCVRAFESYCYRIKKYIGAYVAAMDGVDIIAFGGGIGENNPMVREKILSDLNFLGLKLNKEYNTNDALGERAITSSDSKVCACIVNVDEELIIAQETFKLI